MSRRGEPTDLRRLRQLQERRLLWLVLFSVVVVGALLVGLLYGVTAVFAALLCLAAGALTILLLWGLLTLLGRWVGE